VEYVMANVITAEAADKATHVLFGFIKNLPETARGLGDEPAFSPERPVNG
jgi:hypothetical protein